MGPGQAETEAVIVYWRTEAEEALQVASHLMEKGDYSYALFFGHLAIEKFLKATYVARRGEQAPPIHNLVRLAAAAGLPLTPAQSDALATISAFHVEARYPDVKRSFRRKCTPEFTTQELTRITEYATWLRSLLPSPRVSADS